MYISTKTGYALRALAELVNSGLQKPLSIGEIAARQHLPLKYLEHLFSKLKKAHIVKSRKGAHGGYFLAQKADKISLHDIMKAVEESQNSSYCRDKKIDAEYCQGKDCTFRFLWHRIGVDLDSYFSAISLRQIVNDYTQRNI